MITLHYIGYYGPVTLLMIIVMLLKRSSLLSLQTCKEILLWESGNLLLNIALKSLIRQKRPSNQINLLGVDYTDAKQFGMPSGHSQQVAAAVYLILSLTKSKSVIALALSQSIATTFQRVFTRKHTLGQVTVGIIVGTIYSHLWRNRVLTWKFQTFSL